MTDLDREGTMSRSAVLDLTTTTTTSRPAAQPSHVARAYRIFVATYPSSELFVSSGEASRALDDLSLIVSDLKGLVDALPAAWTRSTLQGILRDLLLDIAAARVIANSAKGSAANDLYAWYLRSAGDTIDVTSALTSIKRILSTL